MSASDKKKLRKEQTAELLTQKQRQQQAEAKKLKFQTITFVSVLVLVVCLFLTFIGVQVVNNTGVIQKNTLAATIGDKEFNSVELSYYYNDAINELYNQWYNEYESYTDGYLQAMGLDTSKPLDEQIHDEETGITWAQYFVNEAIKEAKSDMVLYNLAKKEGFKLPEEEQTSLDNMLKNIETYAVLYGYGNADQYLRASYGYGADVESYSEYMERSTIADAYSKAHMEDLTYDDAAIREYEKDKVVNYNSYTYASAYLSYSYFLEGGTKNDKGETTYTEEEKDAARAAMKAAAEELATATSVAQLKEKAEAVKLTGSSKIAVNEVDGDLYTVINGTLNKWLSEKDRKEGDIAAIPSTSTVKDAEGKESTETNGYYVAYFISSDDNTDPMANVRHLLVKFKGGTEDEETEEITYSEAEMNEAKEKAEGYLKTWKEGKANEESFIELVKKHSDDTSAEDGGLFEDINPDSQYVPEFLAWAISDDRKAGDAEVIKTEYGYHVMYYVGDDELSYRDYMISEEMRAEDQEEWYQGVLETITTTQGDISKLNLDLVISPK